jgi:FAD/FMN-containing dehydrogenase
MLVPFFNAALACEAVAAIFNAGITPSGMEFMEHNALKWSQAFSGDFSIEVKDNHAAHLLIEVDGFDPEQLMKECEAILAVLEDFQTDEILFAESEAQKNTLWSLRRKVGEAVKAQSVYKEEDTVVPRYQLPKLLQTVKAVVLNLFVMAMQEMAIYTSISSKANSATHFGMKNSALPFAKSLLLSLRWVEQSLVSTALAWYKNPTWIWHLAKQDLTSCLASKRFLIQTAF